MASRKQPPADLTGIRQRGNRFQVRIFGGMDPATGRQLVLTGSAKSQTDAVTMRDGFRKQIESQTAVRTNVTLAVLLDEWLASHSSGGATTLRMYAAWVSRADQAASELLVGRLPAPPTAARPSDSQDLDRPGVPEIATGDGSVDTV